MQGAFLFAGSSMDAKCNESGTCLVMRATSCEGVSGSAPVGASIWYILGCMARIASLSKTRIAPDKHTILITMPSGTESHKCIFKNNFLMELYYTQKEDDPLSRSSSVMGCCFLFLDSQFTY